MKANKFQKEILYIDEYISPIGKLFITSDGNFLTGLWFENSFDEQKHTKKLTYKNLEIFNQTKHWLDIYFAGKNPDFLPKIKVYGLTPFRKQVIDIMQKIPYGTVITYNDIAKQIALNNNIKKMSAQAVGGAVGWNPICIIIPCHRVVGSNNKLVGYGGGMQNKVKLLQTENFNLSMFTDLPN